MASSERVKERANVEEYLSIDKAAPEALLKRLLDLAGKEAGTPQGRMLIRGQISKKQYAACCWFEKVYERYLAAIGRSRGLRTSTGERYERGHDPDGDSVAGMEMAASDAAAVKEYESVRLAAKAAGLAAFDDFWRTVIDGHRPEDHYGLTAVAKVASAIEKHRRAGWKSRRR